MTKEEKIDQLREAQDMLREALRLIKVVAAGDRVKEVYVTRPLTYIIGEDPEYVNHSVNLESWIAEIETGNNTSNEEV